MGQGLDASYYIFLVVLSCNGLKCSYRGKGFYDLVKGCYVCSIFYGLEGLILIDITTIIFINIIPYHLSLLTPITFKPCKIDMNYKGYGFYGVGVISFGGYGYSML